MLDDLLGLIGRIIKWIGVVGGIKIALLVFGPVFLVVVLHFAWSFFASVFGAIWYTWQHRSQVTSSGGSAGLLLMLPALRMRFRRQY